MMKWKYTFLLLFYFGKFSAQNELQNQIQKLVSLPFYKNANIGISVRNVADGGLLADMHKDKLMIPASTLKLITTFVALDVLGEDYRFKTQLAYDGEIDPSGTLKGNIYIIGGGDPTLASTKFEKLKPAKQMLAQMVADIKAAGIYCIEGNIVADASMYSGLVSPSSWQWNDIGNYYGSGAWALNWSENIYNVYFDRSREIGGPTFIQYIEPYIPQLQLKNEVTVDSAQNDDNAYIMGGPGQYDLKVVGSLPQGRTLYKIKGSIPEPPLFIAYALSSALIQNGIAVYDYTWTDAKIKVENQKIITSYNSPSLKDIVYKTNMYSVNVFAEAMLKQMGLVKKNHASIDGGIETVKDYFTQRQVNTDAFIMADGSGLSTRNWVSADFMTEYLYRFMYNKDEAVIKSLLPEVGSVGTVRKLLTNSKAKGKIWAKSGSMQRLMTYAGYCKTASGKFVAFTIFLNGAPTDQSKENKEELSKIMEVIFLFS